MDAASQLRFLLPCDPVRADDRCTACKALYGVADPSAAGDGGNAASIIPPINRHTQLPKFRDGIRDEHGWKRLFYCVLAFLARHGYRQNEASAGIRPRGAGEPGCARPRGSGTTPSLDRAARSIRKDTRGGIEALPNDERRRILRELLYHTGRFISSRTRGTTSRMTSGAVRITRSHCATT